MPNVMTDFDHLKTKSVDELLLRQQSLKAHDPSGKSLSDEILIELIAIFRILKTRAAPPRVSSGSKKITPTLDAL